MLDVLFIPRYLQEKQMDGGQLKNIRIKKRYAPFTLIRTIFFHKPPLSSVYRFLRVIEATSA